MKTKGAHKMIDRCSFFFIFKFSRRDEAKLFCFPLAVGGRILALSSLYSPS